MIQDRWFELRATSPESAITHCLIRLNNPQAVAAARRWDLAAELATTVLGRCPTTDELKPISSDLVTELTGFTSNRVFLQGSVLGLKPDGKATRNLLWQWLRIPLTSASKQVAKRAVETPAVADGLALGHGARP